MNAHLNFDRNYRNANNFLNIFERLLSREKLDLEDASISFLFEIIATNLLIDNAVYFDGITDLTAKIRKSRQAEFSGRMWVGGHKKQWLEPFGALVTDKRITKQGVQIRVQVGIRRAEGDLSEAFNLPEDYENSQNC